MVAPAAAGLMLAVTLGASIWALNSFKDKSSFAHDTVQGALTKVAGVQAELHDTHLQLYRTTMIAGSLDAKALKAESDRRAAKLGAVAAQATKEADASPDPAIQKDLRSFVALIAKYQKGADSAIDLSTVDINTGVAALQSADADFKTMNALLTSVVGHVSKRTADITVLLDAAAQRSSWILACVGLLAVLGALVFSWLTQRRIVANINVAVQASAHVAEGRLDVRPHSDDKDEIGDLVRALGSMVGQLNTSIQTVRQATESIGTASAEIAIGNLDLSQRTEQTASNLQQTTTL